MKSLKSIYVDHIEWSGLFVFFMISEICVGGYYVMKGFWKTLVLFYDVWTTVAPCVSCLVQPMCSKVCDRESKYMWLHEEYDEKIGDIKYYIKHIDYTEMFQKCCTVIFITAMASLLIFEICVVLFLILS